MNNKISFFINDTEVKYDSKVGEISKSFGLTFDDFTKELSDSSKQTILLGQHVGDTVMNLIRNGKLETIFILAAIQIQESLKENFTDVFKGATNGN